MSKPKLRFRLILVLAVALAALPVLLTNNFLIDVAIRIAMNACIAIALNLLMGYAGQVSLGHAGFFAMGAYGTAVLTSRYGWPPALALASAAGVSSLLAMLVSKPIFTLKGHYLAMATFGLGSLVHIVTVSEVSLTGGPDGMSVPGLEVFGFLFDTPLRWYGLAAGLLLLLVIATANLTESPFGRALQAIHGSENAARSAGVDIATMKMKIFTLSALLTSLVGGLSAQYIGFVTPGVAGILHSIEMVTMVVIGGMASIGGSIVGAVLITVLPQVLSTFEGWETVVFGAILMLGMIFMPRGVWPSLKAKWGRA